MDKTVKRFIDARIKLINELLHRGDRVNYRLIRLKSKMKIAELNRRAQKVRAILEPCDALKVLQSEIAQMISNQFVAHPIAHAYAKNRGIVSNARQHIGARLMLQMDFRNFFNSIRQSEVEHRLRQLWNDTDGYYAAIVARICCHRGVLPQGTPTSPILSNLVCYDLDVGLAALARSFGCSASRYADDIGISTKADRFPDGIAQILGRNRGIRLSEALYGLIRTHGFTLNKEKLRFLKRPARFTVTGISVTEYEISVSMRYRRRLRAILDNCRKNGFIVAARDNDFGSNVGAFTNWLQGSISYVGQVMGKSHNAYLSLLDAFEVELNRHKGYSENSITP